MKNIFLSASYDGHVNCFDLFDNFINYLEKELELSFSVFNEDGSKLIRGVFDFEVNINNSHSIEAVLERFYEEDDYPFKDNFIEYFKERLEIVRKKDEEKEKKNKERREEEEYKLYLKLKEKFKDL